MIVKIFVQVLCTLLLIAGLNLQGSQGNQSTQRTMPTVLHDVLVTMRTTTQRTIPTPVLRDVTLTGGTTTQRAKPTTVLHDVTLAGRTKTQRAKPTPVLHDVTLTGRTKTQRAKPTPVLRDVTLTGRTTTRRISRRPTSTIHDKKLRNGLQNSPSHGRVEADVSRENIHSSGEREADVSNDMHSPVKRKAELSITTTPTLQEHAMDLSMLGPLHNLTYHGRFDHDYYGNEYRHVLYDHCARRIGWKKCIAGLAPPAEGEQVLCNMIQARKTYNGSITMEKHSYIYEYFDYYNLDTQDLYCVELYTGLTMADYIVMYVVCSLGLLCNGLSIITIYTADNKLTSTSIYLIALAISDSVYLLYNIALFEQGNIFMKEIGDNVVASISAWFLVVITVERFLSIYNPYKVHDHCYPRSAMMYVASVLFVLSTIHTTIYLAGAYEDSYDSYLSFEEWMDASKILTVMLFVLIFGGPFLLILTLNIAIIRILYKAAKHRQKISKSDWDKEKQITRTLVIVTTAYIVFIGPFYTIEVIFAFTGVLYSDYENGHILDLTKEYLDKLKILNYCINFLIYTLCGSKYRESFLSLLKRTRCKHHTHVV